MLLFSTFIKGTRVKKRHSQSISLSPNETHAMFRLSARFRSGYRNTRKTGAACLRQTVGSRDPLLTGNSSQAFERAVISPSSNAPGVWRSSSRWCSAACDYSTTGHETRSLYGWLSRTDRHYFLRRTGRKTQSFRSTGPRTSEVFIPRLLNPVQLM